MPTAQPQAAKPLPAAGTLSPTLYLPFRRRLWRIRLVQALRVAGDSLGQRWLSVLLVVVVAFLVAIPATNLLPWSLMSQLAAALGGCGLLFGGLLALMHWPSDRQLAEQRRSLELVLPSLELAWKQHCIEVAAARAAERARRAEERRLAAEARQRAAEEARQRAAEAQRQQALRSGTATLSFDNQTDSPALVKVIGPVQCEVMAAKGGSGTVHRLPAGRYLIKVRYGTCEADYNYSEGDPFTLEDYSLCRITLHKVVGGNYGSRRINKGSF